jgi:hypothetical protein
MPSAIGERGSRPRRRGGCAAGQRDEECVDISEAEDRAGCEQPEMAPPGVQEVDGEEHELKEHRHLQRTAHLQRVRWHLERLRGPRDPRHSEHRADAAHEERRDRQRQQGEAERCIEDRHRDEGADEHHGARGERTDGQGDARDGRSPARVREVTAVDETTPPSAPASGYPRCEPTARRAT